MATASASSAALMDELLTHGPAFSAPILGSLVEGQVIDVFGNKILLDIAGVAVGMISGKESHDEQGTLGHVKPGDTISAYVIEGENDEGYYGLSLRRASQERTWQTFLKAYANAEVITVTIHEANKGGLLVIVDGIKGFIPVSQLAPLHYPRVDGANSSEILSRLQKLVGTEMKVKIINVDQEGSKLILSEKAAIEEQRSQALKSIKVGDTVSGTISGIVKFGIFVAFDGLEGLVHISEIEWGHVKDPVSYGRIGDPVTVQIIGVDGEKISLSMKRLTPDPWKKAAGKYTVGKVVNGKVDRITQFGVFVKLEDDICGLVHLTELATETVKDPQKLLKVGQDVEAKIIAMDPEDHRIGLSIKALSEPVISQEVNEQVSKEADETPESASEKKKVKAKK